jgi:hypothetical protein
MAQVVRCCLLTGGPSLHMEVLCGICGGQCGTGTVLSPDPVFPLSTISLQLHIHLHIILGMENAPINGQRSIET